MFYINMSLSLQFSAPSPKIRDTYSSPPPPPLEIEWCPLICVLTFWGQTPASCSPDGFFSAPPSHEPETPQNLPGAQALQILVSAIMTAARLYWKQNTTTILSDIILLKFSPTWSCVSLPRPTTFKCVKITDICWISAQTFANLDI